MDALNVQYGAGWTCAAGWLNFDASPSLRLERLPVVGKALRLNAERFPEGIHYGDIVKGLPVADGSAKAVYASHVLEHLCFTDFQAALRNTLRLLRPGGAFRLVVPDLYERANRYVSAAGQNDEGAAPTFLNTTLLGRRTRPRSAAEYIRAMLGNAEHLWMWDEASMRRALLDAGFTGVRRCALGDSDDPDFSKVEAADRFVDTRLNIVELAMEGRRPNA
jgi:predicted SAM-dependent methyltransferase